MIRKIIEIDEKKCNGCGACAAACHEGAIEMVNGKAKLTREDYCDGLGDCLPACPTDAISFVEREAPAYNEAAVKRAKSHACPSGGCPGVRPKIMQRENGTSARSAAVPSRLNQWPCQIKLVPTHAPYFEDAHLLIAADCTAYAYGDFHNTFMRNRITLIGCPKLDAVDYAVKLGAIFAYQNIKSVTVTRMQVPCCGGLEFAVRRAIEGSGKQIPLQVVTISPDGEIL